MKKHEVGIKGLFEDCCALFFTHAHVSANLNSNF